MPRTQDLVCRSCRNAGSDVSALRRWWRGLCRTTDLRRDHRCHGAVVAGQLDGRVVWRSCECTCQRTLEALGFFENPAVTPAGYAHS
jgi:hypothetical protein